MKSGRLAVNVLIDLKIKGIPTNATFDFITKNIYPIQAKSNESNKLIEDYMSWLPEHFINHQSDIEKLEKLETTISIDFNKMFSPPRMNDTIQIQVVAKTKWKADGREEQILEIKQSELIKRVFLKLRIPEMK